MRDTCSYRGWCFAAFPLLLLAGILLAPTPATAQSDAEASADLYEQGKKLWVRTGCVGCHTIGQGRMAGPDLQGVTQRRQEEWLRRFLADTDEMLDTDPLAQRMLELNYYQRMPEIELRDEEITALLQYIAQKSANRPSAEDE